MQNIVTVSARNQRISPKKARLVFDLIRVKTVDEAMSCLNFLDQKGAQMVLHLLTSAVSAAKAKDFKSESLVISEAVCSEGRKLKRHHPNARGRTNTFQKRMSHFRLSLGEIEQKDMKAEKSPSQAKVAPKRIKKEKDGSKS